MGEAGAGFRRLAADREGDGGEGAELGRQRVTRRHAARDTERSGTRHDLVGGLAEVGQFRARPVDFQLQIGRVGRWLAAHQDILAAAAFGVPLDGITFGRLAGFRDRQGEGRKRPFHVGPLRLDDRLGGGDDARWIGDIGGKGGDGGQPAAIGKSLEKGRGQVASAAGPVGDPVMNRCLPARNGIQPVPRLPVKTP